MRGKLILITGTMGGGKTRELINKVTCRREYFGEKVFVFKPDADTRSSKGKIESVGKEVTLSLDAYEIRTSDPWEAVKIMREIEKKEGKFDAFACDEVQFFSNESGFCEVVDYLLQQGYNGILAGLDRDFRGLPFGCTLSLIRFARENVIWTESACEKCKKKQAHLPQRIVNGKPAHYNSKLISPGGRQGSGDKIHYEARCYECHELPGKPMPPV